MHSTHKFFQNFYALQAHAQQTHLSHFKQHQFNPTLIRTHSQISSQINLHVIQPLTQTLNHMLMFRASLITFKPIHHHSTYLHNISPIGHLQGPFFFGTPMVENSISYLIVLLRDQFLSSYTSGCHLPRDDGFSKMGPSSMNGRQFIIIIIFYCFCFSYDHEKIVKMLHILRLGNPN